MSRANGITPETTDREGLRVAGAGLGRARAGRGHPGLRLGNRRLATGNGEGRTEWAIDSARVRCSHLW